MSANGTMSDSPRILVIRLGAMGDIFHAMPAVASIRAGLPASRITWVVEKKWLPILEGCPFVNQLLAMDRKSAGTVLVSIRKLRAEPFDLAIDFQGLLKSALIAVGSGAGNRLGFSRDQLREPLAGLFYTQTHAPIAVHMVDRHLELATVAGGHSTKAEFYLPEGRAEGQLPEAPFVLSCPQAGWGAKQWPSSYYGELGDLLKREMGLTLVLNGPPGAEEQLRAMGSVHAHCSDLPGLIWATRRALAVVGLDSGPVHMAAAIGKPGVAIFGPTDPARNGPYGGSISVLRTPDAETTYKRREDENKAMRSITPRMVVDELKRCLATYSQNPTPTR